VEVGINSMPGPNKNIHTAQSHDFRARALL
jgi:hypothetical protein